MPVSSPTSSRAYAEFFSFGTNDLTQTTYGYSRDDAEARSSRVYLEKGSSRKIRSRCSIGDGRRRADAQGVAKGRATRPELKIGICGEHGGEPWSVAFCDEIGLDYVSCSPYRVPIAALPPRNRPSAS